MIITALKALIFVVLCLCARVHCKSVTCLLVVVDICNMKSFSLLDELVEDMGEVTKLMKG